MNQIAGYKQTEQLIQVSHIDVVVTAGSIISDLFNGNSYVIVIAPDGTIVKTWDIPQMPFGLEVGNLIPEGTVSREALIKRKRIVKMVEKEKSYFGFGCVGIGLPIF